MTSNNVFEAINEVSDQRANRALLDIAEVVEAPSHTLGDDNEHVVRVKPRGRSPRWAQYGVDSLGDVHIPNIEDTEVWVLIGRVSGEIPVVLSVLYVDDEELPEYEAGERHIGHDGSESFIQLDNDGHVTVETEAGDRIYLGDVGEASEEIVVETDEGDSIVLNDANGEITVTHNGGSEVALASTEVRVNASDKVLLQDESGSTKPVARKDDPVEVSDPDSGTLSGTITGGSGSVESA